MNALEMGQLNNQGYSVSPLPAKFVNIFSLIVLPVGGLAH
jgi:hypothetical protein